MHQVKPLWEKGVCAATPPMSPQLPRPTMGIGGLVLSALVTLLVVGGHCSQTHRKVRLSSEASLMRLEVEVALLLPEPVYRKS